MGWSSYIRTDGGLEPARFGTAAGTCTGSGWGCVGTGTGSGRGAFDAATAAESFHDGAAIDRSTAAYV